MAEFRREIRPADRFEDEVVRALKARSLIRPSAASRLGRAAIVAAAAVLLVAGGFAAGRSPAPAISPDAGGPRFVLLLHETPATTSVGISEQALVDEYRAWARQVSAGGHPITGEKLKREPGHTLSGFFIVDAPSIDVARSIAASSPHVRYGGRIDVREIATT